MDIKEIVTKYLNEELLIESEDVIESDDMALLSSGVIDSLTTLKLVDFVEEKFLIEFEAHEVTKENLDTIKKIEAFVTDKMN